MIPEAVAWRIDVSKADGRDGYENTLPKPVLDDIDNATGNPNGLLAKLAYAIAEGNRGKFIAVQDQRIEAGSAVFLAHGLAHRYGGCVYEPRLFAENVAEELAEGSGLFSRHPFRDPVDVEQLAATKTIHLYRPVIYFFQEIGAENRDKFSLSIFKHLKI